MPTIRKQTKRIESSAIRSCATQKDSKSARIKRRKTPPFQNTKRMKLKKKLSVLLLARKRLIKRSPQQIPILL